MNFILEILSAREDKIRIPKQPGNVLGQQKMSIVDSWPFWGGFKLKDLYPKYPKSQKIAFVESWPLWGGFELEDFNPDSWPLRGSFKLEEASQEGSSVPALNSGFCSMKRLGVFLLLYTPGWREAL